MRPGSPATLQPASPAGPPQDLAVRNSEAASHCVHCGQAVFHGSFRNPAGETFCCEGCLKVHAVIGASDWGRYYDLLEQSGKRPPQAGPGADYRDFLATLDEAGALEALGRWDGRKHSVSLECREITCAGCAWLLEKLLRDTPGVAGFEVDFLHGEAFLEYDAEVANLKSILEGFGSYGYRLRPKSAAAPDRPAPDRALLYRMAVSAACFANSMAFSSAVYLGAFRGMSPEWVSAFGAAGFAISVPAVFYGAYPFYAGAWRALRGRRFNVDVTVTIGILLSFILSAASAIGGGDANFSDSLTGLIFFLLLGRWGVRRFEAGLALKGRWFEALRPGKIRVRRPGGTETVEWDRVSPGDIAEVSAGAYVPVDGALEGPEAWMDASLLTGESRAVRLHHGDSVFAGYLNLRGHVAVRVTGAAGTTRIAALGRELEALARGRRPAPDGTGAVAKWFTLAVAVFAVLAAFLHAADGSLRALAVSASVFIISCSCALALAAPISRGLGLRRARALGFHFRSQTTLEALKDVGCVLLDKTGTLTFTRRSLSSVIWAEPWNRDEAAREEALAWLKAVAKRSLHPVSLSLCRALDSVEEGRRAFVEVRELAHFGMVGRMAGSRFREICLCRYGAWDAADGIFASLGYAVPDIPRGQAAGPLPETCLFLDGRLAALFRFSEEIKPEVREFVSRLRERGLAVALLSGDNREKVAGFAAACGIGDFHSALSPEAKRALALEYRARHGRTLAVGDGFNDSLLFGASDFAMAVEGGAVDLLSGIDILSTGGRPADIGRLLALSHAVNKSIRLSFWASGIYNAAAVAVALQGLVTPLLAAILMPLSGLSLCAIAYAVIPGSRRPRS